MNFWDKGELNHPDRAPKINPDSAAVSFYIGFLPKTLESDFLKHWEKLGVDICGGLPRIYIFVDT